MVIVSASAPKFGSLKFILLFAKNEATLKFSAEKEVYKGKDYINFKILNNIYQIIIINKIKL